MNMREVTELEIKHYELLETDYERIEYIAFLLGLRKASDINNIKNKQYFKHIKSDPESFAKLQTYIEEENEN